MCLTLFDRDTEGYTVTVPAEIGYDLGTNYDWNLVTVGQEYLDGHAVTLNQGKVVGGGTILNGMVWTRGSAKDYDAWDNLNNIHPESKRYNWQWSDLVPYFQKVRHQREQSFGVNMADTERGGRAKTTP